MMAKRSPPTPTIIGSTTLSTAAEATAASTALPPCWRIRSPACDASGWLVTTMPRRAMTSDRLCASHPSARSPRTPLQNAGAGVEIGDDRVGKVFGAVDERLVQLPHDLDLRVLAQRHPRRRRTAFVRPVVHDGDARPQ